MAQVTHGESAGSSSKAQARGADAANRTGEAADAAAANSTAEATHVATEAAHMSTATHMATPAASCLCIGGKQTAGQQSARQDYHRSSHHRIVLSVQSYLRCVGRAAATVSTNGKWRAEPALPLKTNSAKPPGQRSFIVGRTT
jgi:hypothetical protein